MSYCNYIISYIILYYFNPIVLLTFTKWSDTKIILFLQIQPVDKMCLDPPAEMLNYCHQQRLSTVIQTVYVIIIPYQGEEMHWRREGMIKKWWLAWQVEEGQKKGWHASGEEVTNIPLVVFVCVNHHTRVHLYAAE